jgi:oxygen-independent coproporphyrinogen-3 oxidase
MAGIYIHIPFCKQACNYCNFHFSTQIKNAAQMIDAIVKEMQLRKDYLTEPIDTIYFGGGTPSVIEEQDLDKIFEQIYKLFSVHTNAEITLEANPDDISKAKLSFFKKININRLSIGVQSFFENDLHRMHRAHNAEQATGSIKMAQDAGFHNITIDLIYGTPTLSDEQWKYNVDTAFGLNVPHLSCYALTVEPRTALANHIAKGKAENIDPENQSRHFELLMQWAREAGWEHYEISNFAKPGFRSIHNSNYWKGAFYLGLGPSAHSYNGISRQWNVANNSLYIQSLTKKIVPFEIEYLSSVQQWNEYIMTALRTCEGITLRHVREKWGDATEKKLLTEARKWMLSGKMICEKDFLKLTDAGKLFADGIAAELFT